jgi:hypothetical protein
VYPIVDPAGVPVGLLDLEEDRAGRGSLRARRSRSRPDSGRRMGCSDSSVADHSVLTPVRKHSALR